MSDRPDQPDGELPDDDSLDWLQDADSAQDSGPRQDSTGLTGQLDWEAAKPDDSPGAKASDDDLSFDWQGESTDNDAPRGDSTGLTGQLSWQTGVHDTAADAKSASDDDLAFDWQDAGAADASASSRGDSTGLTGQLEWRDDVEERIEQQLDDAQAAEERVDDAPQLGGLLNQLGDDDDGDFDAPASGDVPAWLADMGEEDVDTAPEDDPPPEAASSNVPDWLAVDFGADDDEDEIVDDAALYMPDAGDTEAEADGTPDWLMGGFDDNADETDDFDDAPYEDDTQAEADGTPDWLMGGFDDNADEADDFDDTTYEADDRAEADGTPDWLMGGFDDNADEADDFDDTTYEADDRAEADGTPDWLMGGFDDNDDDADDFDDTTYEDDAQAEADGTPDWLMGGFDDNADETDDFDDTTYEADTQAEADDSMDWLADLGFDDGGETDESEFGVMGVDDSAEAANADLFAELGLEADDLETDDEDFAAFAGELTDDSDDFGFDFDEDDEDEDAATRIDTDYLRSMGIGEPGTDGTADDLDWFAEPESETDSDDPDWLNQLGEIEDLDELLAEQEEAAKPVEPAAPADPLADLDALLETFETPDSGGADDDLSDLLGELEQLDDVDLSDIAVDDDQPASIGMTGMLNELDPASEDEASDPMQPRGALTGMLDEWNLEDDIDAAVPDSPEDIAALLDSLDVEDDDDDFDIEAFDPDAVYLEEADEDDAPLAEPNADFQAMLDAYGVKGDEPLPEDAPDWLRELRDARTTNQDVLASALIREKGDKSLEDLPDRLLELRERGLNIAVTREQDAASAERIAQVVPNAKESLLPAKIETESNELVGEVNLSPEQQERAALLRDVVGAAAILPTVSPLPPAEMADLDDLDPDALLDDAPEESPTPRARPRRRRKRQLDRVLLSLLILGLIVLPFFIPPARIGILPPSQLPAGSPAIAVFERVESIAPGDLVLVAVEYGLSATGELDGATDALLRHIVLKGGRPLVVSTNAAGLLHSANIMEAIAANGLQANRDYYILQYLPAGAVGLRDLTLNLVTLANTDYQNRATDLSLASFDDFALIVIITDQAESIRAWSEQVSTQTNAPIVAAISFAAAPLSEPYLAAGGVDGVLVGYEDAFSYAAMLKTGAPEATPEITPEAEATSPPPTPTLPPPTATPVEESTAEIDAGAAAEDDDAPPTETPTATVETPVATATEEPTATTPPTETPTTTVETPVATTVEAEAQATSTPEPPPTTAPAAETVEFAVNISGGAVNLRGGPGTNFPVVATALNGEAFIILDFNDDASWIQIQLPDGREAWIAAFLVEIRETSGEDDQSSNLKQTDILHRWKQPAAIRYRPVRQAEATPEAAAEADGGLLGMFGALRAEMDQTQAEAEPEITPEATPDIYIPPELDAAAIANGTQADDPLRWYAMTLGIFGAVVFISLGTLVNLIRHLLRREED